MPDIPAQLDRIEGGEEARFRQKVLSALPKIDRLYEIIIGEGDAGLLERVRILESIHMKRLDALEESHKEETKLRAARDRVFWVFLTGLALVVATQLFVLFMN